MLHFKVGFRHRLTMRGEIFIWGGVGNTDIQGFPFQTRWQNEEPSVAGAVMRPTPIAGVKDFFLACRGCHELGVLSFQPSLGAASEEKNPLAQGYTPCRGSPYPVTDQHRGMEV